MNFQGLALIGAGLFIATRAGSKGIAAKKLEYSFAGIQRKSGFNWINIVLGKPFRFEVDLYIDNQTKERLAFDGFQGVAKVNGVVVSNINYDALTVLPGFLRTKITIPISLILGKTVRAIISDIKDDGQLSIELDGRLKIGVIRLPVKETFLIEK